MYNFIVRFLSCFIPNRNTRHAFRAKYHHKTIKDRLRIINSKIDKLIDDMACVNNRLSDNTSVQCGYFTESNDKLNTLMNAANNTKCAIDNQNLLHSKVDYIRNFLTNTTDITRIPSAHGNLRLIQKEK